MSSRSWIIKEYIAHSSNVKSVALGRQSNKVLATSGEDCKINLWGLDNQNCKMSMSSNDTPINCLRFHHKDTKLAGGSIKGDFNIWDLETAKKTHSLSGHKNTINCVEFHRFGDFAATGSSDNNIKLWDLRRKGCIMTYKGHHSPLTCIRFSPDGRWLASSDSSGKLKIWNMTDHKQLSSFNEHNKTITSLEFHNTELLMLSSSEDCTIKIWDLDSMKLLNSFQPNDDNVNIALFHPNESQLLSFSGNLISSFEWETLTPLVKKEVNFRNVKAASIDNNNTINAVTFHLNKITVHGIDFNSIHDQTKSRKSTSNNSVGRKTFAGQISPRKLELNIKKSPDHPSVSDEDIENKQNISYSPPLNGQLSPQEANCRKNNFISPDDLSILEKLNSEHNRVMIQLVSRKRNMLSIFDEWQRKGVKSAIKFTIKVNDNSIIFNILPILLSNLNLWTIDVCDVLLPTLSLMLLHTEESFIHMSLSTLRLIGHTFGDIIRANGSFNDFDSQRDERKVKCHSCYQELMRILDQLKQMKTIITEGRLAEKINEMFYLIKRFE